MERSGGNRGRKRKYLEDGSHDTTLLPIFIDTADQQQQQQQDINFEQWQFGGEFQRFVLNRVHRCQKLAYKLRILNKSGKERVEKGIKDTKISLINIQCLAKSQLSDQIKNIDVSVRGTIIKGLQNLPILSSVHFPSIQKINLIITGYFEFNPGFFNKYFEITIQEPLLLNNVNIINKSNLENLYIQGKNEVEIRDCTFRGLNICCIKNAQVLVINSRISMNEFSIGFLCEFCDSLLMDQITTKDCGVFVKGCGNEVNGFRLCNALVQDCLWSGICVCDKSVGEIQNAHVQGCETYGIEVRGKSTVRYAQIKCENNEIGEFHIFEDCEFLRMN